LGARGQEKRDTWHPKRGSRNLVGGQEEKTFIRGDQEEPDEKGAQDCPVR